MAGEWKRLALSDVIDLIGGGTPKTNVPDYWGGSIPWLSVGDFNTGYRWVSTAEKSITDRGLSESATAVLNQRDIIISARGTVGVVAQLARPMAFNQSCYGIRGKRGIAETDFVYYSLRHAVSEMKQLAHGGVFDTITRDTFKIIEVGLPALSEQRAIAHILGTLDDKIELNRRMNETLEAMVQAIFKSWFVDFDPVRAKVEGCQPSGIDAKTATLFPDSFQDSQVGKIPKGWQVGVLDQLVEVVLGGGWGEDDQIEEGLEPARCIRGADIPDLQLGGTGKMPVRFLKPSSLEKRRLAAGDLVIEISGGSPTQSTGRPVLVSRGLLRRLGMPLVCSNFCRLLKLKSPAFSKFVYLWLRSLYANDEFLQFENGTTGIKNFAFTLFSSSYKLCVPPLEILEAFEQCVSPLFDRQQAGATETDALTAIRDALLPKLLSGEIRVGVN